MAGITAAGTGSGIDVESLVTQLMVAEKTPLTKIATKEATIQSKISLIGQFKSLISSLQTAASGLQNLGKLNGIKATVGNTSALSVTATNDASAASYSVDVLQLAKSQQIVSASGKFASASDVLVAKDGETAASATITINFGSITETTSGTPAVTVKSFSADSSRKQEITVSAGDDGVISLQDVADAINGGDYGVKASLISDTTGSVRLSLSGDDTGAENAFKIDVAATTGVAQTKLGYLSFDPSQTSTSFTTSQSAVDSKIKLNGVEITRSTNTIDDAVDGLTFNLKATTTDSEGISTASSLTVSRDASTISTQLQSFVTAYNQLASAISSTTSYDATTKAAGALQGDSTMRSLQNQLRSFIGSTFGDGTNSTKTLSSLGIAVQKDGTLALDSAKLNKAVTNDLDGVIEFLGAFDQTTSSIAPGASKDGFAYKLEQLAKGLLADDGLIDAKLDGLNKTVKDLEKQYERYESRLEQVEKRYRAQFTAMDTAVANMQNLGTYVTQLLNMTSDSSSS